MKFRRTMENIVDTSIVKQERVTPPLDGSAPAPFVIAPINFSGDQPSLENGANVAMVPPYSEQLLQSPMASLSADSSSSASTSGRDSASDAPSTKVTAVDKEGANIDDEYQAFGFIYRDPTNPAKSYLCNFCNYIGVSRKDFMQHSLIHVVQCGSCRYKAFTRLEVIRHTSKYHPKKMHTFDNLQQLNIEWKCKNGAAAAQKKSSKTKSHTVGSKTVSSSRPSSTVSDTSRRSTPDSSDGPPVLIRQSTPTKSNARQSPMSSTPSSDGDSITDADVQKALSDSAGLIQWAIGQGQKMPDYVQAILGSSGALISELKYMMRIVKRSEARYGCIACEEFKCNQYVDFKMHMRDRHQFPQSKMWECGNCNLKYNTARDLLRHTKGRHNRPFEQYCVSVRLPWLVETTGSSPVHANQTDPKCGNCDFNVKTSFARYWHRMQPHRRWMQMPDGGTPLHHAAMIWDVIQTRFEGCTVQSCDKIMKIMFSNIETLTKNWPLSKYYPLSNKSTNIVTWPLTLIDRLKLLCHMKANHPEDWLITVNHQSANKVMIGTRPVRPLSKAQNYIMDANLWNTKGETMLEGFGSPENGTSLTAPTKKPKSDIVTFVIGDTRNMAQPSLVSVLKPIQPVTPTSQSNQQKSQATKQADYQQSENSNFVSPLLTAGALPLLPPADYEEPDPALDYIDPRKRELIDLGYQETLTLKNAHGVEGVDCIVVYYKETAPDLLINHRDHFITKIAKDGSMSAQCKQCNKTLQGKNAGAHMKDHVASHTGGRLYECAYCERQALRPGLMCDHVRKMHPNRVLLIVKRKARITSAMESNSGYSGAADSSGQHVSSSEDSQDVSSTQDDSTRKRPASGSFKRAPVRRRVPLGPKKIIFPASSLYLSSDDSEDEQEPPIWKCPYCSRLFEEEGPAQDHISATHAQKTSGRQSVRKPIAQTPPDISMAQMKREIAKPKRKKTLKVTLYRVSRDQIKDELSDDSDDEDFKSPDLGKKGNKPPERLGRSPMMAYIGQLYREKKGENEKADGQKMSRPRVLPPPHYDHWDLDHVPLKCSQCEFNSTHDVVKAHYKAKHLKIFPTAFDLEAKHKKKKYTVFMCPSTGCGFTTYWKEVINHHTKGHRFNRNEIDGLIFKVFGDKTPPLSGNRKRKQDEEESDETSPQRSKKKRKLDKEENPIQSDEVAASSSYVPSEIVFPEAQEVTSTNTEKKFTPGKTTPKGVVKKNYSPTKPITLKISLSSPKKGRTAHIIEKGQSIQKKKQTQNVTKGKVVLDRAIKARREALKISTVTPVAQKGGILRSVQLSKHPILLSDLKLDRSQYTEAVFNERFVCPYCTCTGDTAVKIRKHIEEAHKRKDPTVIDRLSYVRKQRCKTFYCWNLDCAFQTAVCEERESHIESSECGSIYEKKFGEPVPSVRDKKSTASRKSIEKISTTPTSRKSIDKMNTVPSGDRKKV